MTEQATPLIGNYSAEDFFTDRPYKELYDARDNKFMQQIMIQKMRDLALSLGFKGFMTAWKAYLASQKSTNVSVDDIGADTMFENQPATLRCGSYSCSDRILRYNEFGIEVEVLSHPLMPTKRVTNIETLEEKLEIAYCRGRDHWKYLTVSREQLASAQKIIGLARHGVAVNSENAKEVVKYMGTIESLNYDELPRQNSVSHMGWLQDGRFMPYVDDVSYDGESPEFQRLYEEFKPHGSCDTWLDIAKEVRAGVSVPARIALAASFAAPLVPIFESLPFFVHLWGETGCGKTVALMLAASVWGNPDVGRYIKSFSGTTVSRELYASFCCNLPILFDELQVISDRKLFDDIIYMLCEGVSKGRGAKEGGLQVQKRWSSCIITTGEMPITQGNSGGGAVSRTIEVNYGGRPLFENPRAVAGTLRENYGHAGPQFISVLKQEGVIKAIKLLQQKFYSALMEEDVNDKQVLSASIILAADALITKALFRDGHALTVDDIKQYLVSRTETDVNLRCYQWLIGFCAANPRRFDGEDQTNGELWGKYEDGYVFINKAIFDDVLKKQGYSAGAFLDWAKRKDMLKCQSYKPGSKNNRLTWQVRIGKKPVPHVVLKLPEEEKSEQEVYQEYVEVNDPDMPF